MRFPFRWTLSLLLIANAVQADPRYLVRMCIDDKPSFFFYNKPGTETSELPGLVFDLIHRLETRLKLDIRVVRRPQHACAVLLEKGDVDAVALMSHTQDREKIGLFPMKNGQPDGDMAVVRTSYFLYIPLNKPIAWDGQGLEGLKGKRLGAMDGFSIVQDLEKAGVKVETFKSVDAMIARLQKNELDAVALNNDTVDRNRARNQIQKHDKPLKTKDYFIPLSRLFQEKYPGIAASLWKESAQFLKTTEGETALGKYEKLENFP